VNVVETYWQIRAAIQPNVDPKTSTTTQFARMHSHTNEQLIYVAALLTVAEVIRQSKGPTS
jgi:hypothetical protein